MGKFHFLNHGCFSQIFTGRTEKRLLLLQKIRKFTIIERKRMDEIQRYDIGANL